MQISVQFGMLSVDALTETGMPLTVRSVFILDPSKTIRLMLTYPASTGAPLRPALLDSRPFFGILKCLVCRPQHAGDSALPGFAPAHHLQET